LNSLTVSFIATGNPWIDCGIISIHDFLKTGRIQPEGFLNVQLNENEVTTTISSSETAASFLESTFDEVKSHFYVKPTGNEVCIFNKTSGNFKVVSKINLVPMVSYLFSGGALKADYGPKTSLTSSMKKKLEKTRTLYRGRKRIDFKTDGKFVYASEPRYNWPFKAGKEGICSFCGRKAACVDIDSNNYPFAVGTNNFQNFFSNLCFSHRICDMCKLASLMAVNRVFFNMSERRQRLFLALPQAYSLRELYGFWRDMPSNVATFPLTHDSNLLSEGYRYRRLNESIIAFCMELYLQLGQVRENDGLIARENRLTNASSKSWHFYMASKAGNILSFDGYAYLTNLHHLFQLFSKLMDLHKLQQLFQHLTVKQGKEWRTALRDEFAQRILKNTSLNDVAERIIWEKSKEGAHLAGFSDFVEEYNLWRG